MLLPPAFAAVTRSLQNLVHTAVPATTEVTSLALADAASSSHQSRVNLYFYRVTRDPAHRIQRSNRPGKTISPALELRYLVTAYANPTLAIGQTEADLLWTTLNVMHDKPHVIVPALGKNVAVRIEAEDLPVSDLTALWQAARTSFRASLAYVVHLPELPALDLPLATTIEEVRKKRLERLGAKT